MPATIQGVVFDDLNGNGIFDLGEPGIPNVFVTLQNPNGICTTTVTNIAGAYIFSGLTVPGIYTIYETVQNPGGICPPTTFTQPIGFTTSTTPRVGTVTVSQTDINNSRIFTNQNFGHQDILVSWDCAPNGLQVAGVPTSNMFLVNLVTGESTNLGLINPPGPYNSIGFNVIDNSIWGTTSASSSSIVRINPDLTTSILSIPNLPALPYVVGDVDLNGHLYLYSPNTDSRFYVIDVNPNSSTYLKLVDPSLGFTLDTAPFGTPIPTDPDIFDWAFDPFDNQLYGIVDTGISGQVVRIDPLTGATTLLTTTGLPGGSLYGAVFFDSQGFLYGINNNTGTVYRITLGAANANAAFFSNSAASTNNDGARCPFALLNLLEVIKSVDQSFATIGDILTYTLVVTNVGNVLDATNVILTDAIPVGTTFIPGSVTVNGSPTPADPAIGIQLGNISPQNSTTVTFQVQIGNTPPNTITNIGSVAADNAAPTSSNQVITQVNNASLSSVKTVNQAIADIGDILTYTITLTNTGNVTASNVVFTDPIPNGTTFVSNSVTVNGASLPGANPAVGFTISSIPPGASTTVTFQVTVTSIPNPNPTINIATTTFEYPVDPNLPPVPGESTTPPVPTQVNNASLSSVKTVNQAIADIGDILTYTITLTNTGNVTASNVVFTDPIPNGTTFVSNSVTVNGASLPGANPAVGFTISSIPPGASTTVTFQVTVTSIPNPNPTINIATTTFEYPVDPNLPPVPGESTTPPVPTQVNNASLSSVKTVNQAIADIGDILTYTITLTNTGNVTASNVVFTDPIPNGTTFVSNSVTVNGASLPGANPAVGFTISSIPPGASTTVTFQVTVTSIPNPNPTINIATTTFEYPVDPNLPPVPGESTTPPVPTQINNASINIVKQVDQITANVGDILTYTLTLTNTGNIPALNVQVKDTVPLGTTFVTSSVTINDVSNPSSNPNNIIFITSINPKEIVTIKFRVTIDFVPPTGHIDNTALVTFYYIPIPNQPPVIITTPSNTVTTVVPPEVSINLCPLINYFNHKYHKICCVNHECHKLIRRNKQI
ncbi:cell wall surface anchor family protein, putative [Bacillus cereus G9241]|nr:cell wall surface anchor family protein, putative [Bacillus cereus G9241]